MANVGFVEDILNDVLEDYLVGKKINKGNFVLKYGAEKIKQNIDCFIKGKEQLEWEFITSSDKKGELLKMLSEFIKNSYDGSIGCFENNIQFKTELLSKILMNIFLYFENEFDDKAEELEAYNHQYGNFENLLEN